MPFKGGIKSGQTCAVPSCKNCWGKIRVWKNQQCEVHVSQKRSECQCHPQPYSFHRIPPRDKVGKRSSCWLRLLGMRKDFIPTENSRICSIHFVDGRPTPENPDPVLYMSCSSDDGSSSSQGDLPSKRRRTTAYSSKVDIDKACPSLSSAAGDVLSVSAKSKPTQTARVPLGKKGASESEAKICFICQKSDPEPELQKVQQGVQDGSNNNCGYEQPKVELVLGLIRILLRRKAKDKMMEQTTRLEQQLMELDYCSNCITELEDIYTNLQQLDQLLQLLWIQKTKIIDKLRFGSCKKNSGKGGKGRVLCEKIIREIEQDESNIAASGKPNSSSVQVLNWASAEENLDWSVPIVKMEEMQNLEDDNPVAGDSTEEVEEEIKFEFFDDEMDLCCALPEEGPSEVGPSNSGLTPFDSSQLLPSQPSYANVPIIVLPPRPQLYHCSQCSTFSAPTPHQLKIHEAKVHSKLLRPFACRFCPSKFKLRAQLRVHEGRHEGKDEGKFLCSVCPKTFPTKARLRKHEAGVHKTGGSGTGVSSSGCGTGVDGGQQFICDICGKGFPISNYLYYHRKTHDTPEEKKARKLKAKLEAEERKAAGLPIARRRLEKKISVVDAAGGTSASAAV